MLPALAPTTKPTAVASASAACATAVARNASRPISALWSEALIAVTPTTAADAGTNSRNEASRSTTVQKARPSSKYSAVTMIAVAIVSSTATPM